MTSKVDRILQAAGIANDFNKRMYFRDLVLAIGREIERQPLPDFYTPELIVPFSVWLVKWTNYNPFVDQVAKRVAAVDRMAVEIVAFLATKDMAYYGYTEPDDFMWRMAKDFIHFHPNLFTKIQWPG